MVKTVIGTKVDSEIKARLTELTEKNGTNVNQLLSELVDDYLNNHDKKRREAQTAVEKVDKKVREAVCPLCDGPLEYSKGWFDDEIRCSNSACDTREAPLFGESKYSLKKQMGEREYLRLLNMRRRTAIEKAAKDQERKERSWWE